MADIFISYAREDRETAQTLAQALAVQGWSVWWDRHVPSGRRFHDVIQRELSAARCVIALWSTAALSSPWVREEAQDGLDRDILVPVKIEMVRLPIGFRTVQTADLSNWNGNSAHPGFMQVVEDIRSVLGGASPQTPVPESEAKPRRPAEASRMAAEKKRRRAEEEARRRDEEERQQREREAAEASRMAAERKRQRRLKLITAVALVIPAVVAGLFAWQRWPTEEQRSEEKARKEEAVLAPAPTRRRVLKPLETFTDCRECPEMVMIPAGTFTMGSPADEPGREPDEGPQHRVTIAPFAMGKTEVTFAQWDACVAAGACKGYTPPDEGWGRGSRPVINISWKAAEAYESWLSKLTGKPYRLPSEAEWEYAARAGTTTPFSFGETITTDQANYNGNYTYGKGAKGVYRRRTTEVESFAANPWGLYDMNGNVWEWVEDVWHNSYKGAPTDGTAWTDGEGTDSSRSRVLRGGSWDDSPRLLRSAARSWSDYYLRNYYLGFRVARTLGQD